MADFISDATTSSPNRTDDVTASAETTDVMNVTWLRAIFISLYSIIVVLGVSGNCLVAYVVLRNPSMQTITNLFITNLAVSDVMMCLLAVPFTPISAWLRSWVFGEVLCHIVPMILGVSVFVSTLTSTAIAVDRYFVIVHPFRSRMKHVTCVIIIVIIWVVSCSISLPLAIYQKVALEENEDEVYICTEDWPETPARKFFTFITLILQYIVPVSIITFCYCKVSFALRVRSRSKIGAGRANRERHQMEIRRKRRTNKMLIAMVSIFVCCWFPLNVIFIASEYLGEEMAAWRFYHLLFFTAHVIAMSSTVYNPFLYGWMNDNFKKEFLEVLPCLLPLPSSTSRGRSDDRRQRPDGSGMQSNYTAIKSQIPLKTRRASTLNGKTFGDDTEALYRVDGERVVLADCALNENDVDE